MTKSSSVLSANVVFGGDLYISRDRPSTMFAGLKDVFFQADAVVINQEIPLSDVGEPWPTKANTKRSPTSCVASMKDVGIDAVMLATNHALDYGYEGLRSTFDVLDRAKIEHAGAGWNAEEAHKPVRLNVNGSHIAILNYSSIFMPGYEATSSRPGISVVRVRTNYALPRRATEMPGAPADIEMSAEGADVERLAEDIKAAIAEADLVCVFWHWGVTGGFEPSGPYQHLVGYQVELGHAAIDLGADLVVGAGPHTLQGVEIYNGKPIVYGIGQIGFDHVVKFAARESALLEVKIVDGGISECSLIPLLASGDGSYHIARGSEAESVYHLVKRLCEPLGTVVRSDGERFVVSAAPNG